MKSFSERLLGFISALSLLSSMVEAADEQIWLPGATGSGPYDVANAWLTAFSAVYREARITATGVGSGSAQKAMIGDIDCEGNPVTDICAQDEIDRALWGMGDAPIASSFYEDHPLEEFQMFPACAGAVAVVHSNEVTGFSGDPLRMTFEVLGGIFNSTIHYWDHELIQELNPGVSLSHTLISVVVRSDSSGQTSIITDALDYNVPLWPDDAIGKVPNWPFDGEIYDPASISEVCAANGTDEETPTYYAGAQKLGVSLGMLRVPYTVGYMEVGFAETLSDFITPVEIGIKGEASSFVGPYEEQIRVTMGGLADNLAPDTLELNLAQAPTPIGGYPIAGYAYWYVKKNHTYYSSCYQAWLLCKFVEWSYTDIHAAELSVQYGWIVPPESVVEIVLERLRDVQCLDTEVNPPAVISALDYVPKPYRTAKEIDVVLIATTTAAAFIVTVVLLLRAIEMYRRGSDNIWKVNKDELIFSEPPEIIGRGSFGLVLLAEYRGTQVAVKRALPPNARTSDKNRGSGGSSLNLIFDAAETASEDNTCDTDDDKMPPKPSSQTTLTGGKDSLMLANGSLAAMIAGQSSSGGATLRQKKGSRSMMHSRKAFINEMRILAKLRHPCITTVMGAVLNLQDEPMLVMEYMEHGSLHDLLHNDTMVLDEDIVVPIIQDVSQGIRFLHSALPPIVHGDLKAKNVLVDRKFRAKVADFGLTQGLSQGQACGSPYFMAPELLAGRTFNTASSDIYAFGILLYECYSRKDPYDGEKLEIVLREVMDPEINKRPPFPSNMPGPFQALMHECLEADPELRPTATELDSRLKRINTDLMAETNRPLRPKNSNVSLFDIFPRHVAEALRDGRTVEPEHKDCITLFFSDIVGFTDMSAQLEPGKVAALLDRLYNTFDDLSSKYDVFKVETIGDAYMACTNLVKDQTVDHAKRVAMFAIEAVEAASATLIDVDNPDFGTVNLRVGFHSGPVVADVVGNRNPRYCLFGDTVNTASRMESTSEKNRIQCSKRAYDLLAEQMPELPMNPRGKIKIKGKGEMVTFWVNEKPVPRARPSLSLRQSMARSGSGRDMTSFDSIPEHAAKRPSGEIGTMGKAVRRVSEKIISIPTSLFSPKEPGPGTPKSSVKSWLAQNGEMPPMVPDDMA
eukprot:Nitzschia sp. Nitz4//scaffold85_size83877//9444//12857//NITZ4_005217-RA/size83877-processed-gene-0.133-mRNA-1//-1//CDS//3329559101//6651//frame0